MIRIRAWRLLTAMGDTEATRAALASSQAQPGILPGPLLVETLLKLVAEGPWSPDWLCFASAKGDCPLWVEGVMTDSGSGIGGPGFIADALGQALGCPGLAVSAACASGPVALAVASRALRSGRVKRVLVVSGDRLAPLESEGFAALGALDPDTVRPFDKDRNGLALGETAAAVWCEWEPASAEANPGSRALYLHGWGSTCDANHLTGPSRDGSGLAAACLLALTTNGTSDSACDLVVAHGTGTRFNDDSESLAYAAVCPDTPVVGWKGGLGHSLGSCGLAEVVIAAECMAHRRLVPGTQGLREASTAGAIHVLPPGEFALPLNRVLSANAGFGGLNAAVCLSSNVTPLPPLPQSQPRLMWRLTLSATGWSKCSASGQEQAGGVWPTPADAGTLPRLSAKQLLGRLDATWGRMDLACRLASSMGILGGPFPTETGVILCSHRICSDSDRRFESGRRQGLIDPQLFPYTLPSTALGELSIRCQLRGPAITLPGADDDSARLVAQELLEDGLAMVLVMRIEADRAPHCAWLEAWTTESEITA